MGNKKFYKIQVKNILSNCVYFKNNFSNLPSNNTLFLVNYPMGFLDYLIPVIIPKKFCFVTSNKARFFLEKVYNKEDYYLLDKKNNYKVLLEFIQNKIKSSSIFIYVEDIEYRYDISKIGKMRKGAFYIAKKLNITITPLFIGKLSIGKQLYIQVGNTQFVKYPEKSMKKVKKFLMETKKIKMIL